MGVYNERSTASTNILTASEDFFSSDLCYSSGASRTPLREEPHHHPAALPVPNTPTPHHHHQQQQQQQHQHYITKSARMIIPKLQPKKPPPLRYVSCTAQAASAVGEDSSHHHHHHCRHPYDEEPVHLSSLVLFFQTAQSLVTRFFLTFLPAGPT